MRTGYLITGIALAALILLGLNFFFNRSEPEAPPAVVEPVPTPAPESVPMEPSSPDVMEETPPSPVVQEPPPILPSLDASDDFVRERLAGSALPESWLDNSELLRRLAVVVENATRGEIPRSQLRAVAPDLPPQGKFVIREEGESVFMDPEGYERYDRYLDMLESIPVESMATLLSDSYPLLDQALKELGKEETALPQLLSAIDQVLAVPVVTGDIQLLQPKVLYEYADPELEALSPLQKQVLRMGPANAQRLKAYARSLRETLASD